MRNPFHIFLLLIVLTMGCGRTNRIAESLETAESLCDKDPRLAMTMLDSIDSLPMSRNQRHLFDLLSVKSRDKAYIQHTSDSLILDIIDYYSSHRNDKRYAEALYYGGRVYTDLGDLPTALSYYQNALDEIPDAEDQLKFKSHVLSQTGRLLRNIRLYRQALPYLKKSQEISLQLDDTLSIIYTGLDLISIDVGMDSLGLAMRQLLETESYSSSIPNEDKAWLQTEKALILYKEGKTDSALRVIRPLLASVDSLCMNYTLSVATKIYRAAGLQDTAHMYAHRLANSNVFSNRINGFQALFSEDMLPQMPEDSIQPLVYRFTSFMEDYLKRYQAEDAVLRNSKYNYDVQVRQRLTVEKEQIQLKWAAAVTVLILLIAALFLWIKRLKAEIKLRMTLGVLDRIVYEIKPTQTITYEPIQYIEESNISIRETGGDESVSVKPEEKEDSKGIKGLLPMRSREQILKQQILERLQTIINASEEDAHIDEMLTNSKEMKAIKEAIGKGKPIIEKSSLMNQIEEAVHRSSPRFKESLKTLTNGSITNVEYQAALLSRFGIKPKDMAILLGRSRQAISDRRSTLAFKIFEKQKMTDALDKIILRL